jgi:hypothetical protein
MQHCAGFISAGSLYMFRAQAHIIRRLSAYLIVSDGCIRSVEFSFDVLVVVYLSCLFGIPKF